MGWRSAAAAGSGRPTAALRTGGAITERVSRRAPGACYLRRRVERAAVRSALRLAASACFSIVAVSGAAINRRSRHRWGRRSSHRHELRSLAGRIAAKEARYVRGVAAVLELFRRPRLPRMPYRSFASRRCRNHWPPPPEPRMVAATSGKPPANQLRIVAYSTRPSKSRDLANQRRRHQHSVVGNHAVRGGQLTG